MPRIKLKPDIPYLTQRQRRRQFLKTLKQIRTGQVTTNKNVDILPVQNHSDQQESTEQTNFIDINTTNRETCGNELNVNQSNLPPINSYKDINLPETADISNEIRKWSLPILLLTPR